MSDTKPTNTMWHKLLGWLLEEVLRPVGIEVYTEFELMSNPPRGDILLLRKEQKGWTREQLKLLPDGIRQTSADHILIEFKYTESVNENAIRQTLGYDIFYRRYHAQNNNKISTFLVSARKPREAILKTFDYKSSKIQGIYKSKNHFIKDIPIISLNELANNPHNAFIKCFASRKKEKQKAFNNMKHQDIIYHQATLRNFISGLMGNWETGGDKMDKELTPEELIKMGELLGDWYLSKLTPEERLKGLKAEERLKGLTIKEIKDYLNELQKKGH